jgi:hypothetical protein
MRIKLCRDLMPLAFETLLGLYPRRPQLGGADKADPYADRGELAKVEEAAGDAV